MFGLKNFDGVLVELEAGDVAAFFLFGELLVLCFTAEYEVFDDEDVHVGGLKAPKGIRRGADDGLAADVEAGIDHDAASGLLFELAEEAAEASVATLVDGLETGAHVHMSDGGEMGARDIDAATEVGIFHGASLLWGELEVVFFTHVRDDEHVRAIRIMLEVGGDIFAQDDRGKGAKTLAEFDAEIHLCLHSGATGITDDAAAAECAGAELHAAMEPADNFFRGDFCGYFLQQQSLVVDSLIDGTELVEASLHFFIAKARAEQGALHAITRIDDTLAAEELMLDK